MSLLVLQIHTLSAGYSYLFYSIRFLEVVNQKDENYFAKQYPIIHRTGKCAPGHALRTHEISTYETRFISMDSFGRSVNYEGGIITGYEFIAPISRYLSRTVAL